MEVPLDLQEALFRLLVEHGVDPGEAHRHLERLLRLLDEPDGQALRDLLLQSHPLASAFLLNALAERMAGPAEA